jgi:hypothetical protein
MIAFALALYVLIWPVIAAVVLVVIVKAAYQEFQQARHSNDLV